MNFTIAPDFAALKKAWLSNIRGDTLAGMTVALALIPEAIAFSIIAGVDPMVGLYASFCFAVVIAFAGGRPGMISAATGSMALIMVVLVRDYRLEYLLAALSDRDRPAGSRYLERRGFITVLRLR